MNAPVPLTPDQEFELRLAALARDARAAARFTYIGEAIRFSAAPRPELIGRLDEFAGFWNTVLGALQTGAIVALGRMYDQRKDVLSARKLLGYATTDRGLFSEAALRNRVAQRLTAPADVDAYMADYQTPTQTHSTRWPPRSPSTPRSMRTKFRQFATGLSPMRGASRRRNCRACSPPCRWLTSSG